MDKENYITSQNMMETEGENKEAELKIELEVIERRLDEILIFVKNDSEIMDRVKRELIPEIEKRTEEIKVRLRTILKKGV
jgi:hypothetical protein